MRGSSNDDLEEGQQNPTIRYGRTQFPNRQLLLRLRLSVNVLISLASKGTSLYFTLMALFSFLE